VNRCRVLAVVLGLVAVPLVVFAVVRTQGHPSPAVAVSRAAPAKRDARRFLVQWQRKHPAFSCSLNAAGTVASCAMTSGDPSGSSNELVLVVQGSDAR
jgi:hypothetical protein